MQIAVAGLAVGPQIAAFALQSPWRTVAAAAADRARFIRITRYLRTPDAVDTVAAVAVIWPRTISAVRSRRRRRSVNSAADPRRARPSVRCARNDDVQVVELHW